MEKKINIEMSGIEDPMVHEAVVDEAKKQGIVISREIAAVNGTKHWSDNQLRKLVKIAAENKVEVVICPGHLARGLIENPSNVFTTMNYQNTEEIDVYLHEVHRCVKMGFKAVLVWTKSMLEYLDYLRRQGKLPADIIFKMSTFGNNANVLDCLQSEKLGADSINVTNNLSLESLAEIRQALAPRTKIDFHMTYWNLKFVKNEAGEMVLKARPYNRFADAYEVLEVLGDPYLKFESDYPKQQGISVYDLSDPDKWSVEDLCEHKRNDVRLAAEMVRNIREKDTSIKVADWGAKDLRVPVPRK
jgi:hypothetical protein